MGEVKPARGGQARGAAELMFYIERCLMPALDVNAARARATRTLNVNRIGQNIPNFAKAAIALAKFVRKNDYSAIVLSGRSSIIPKKLLSSAWEALFPLVALPPIYNFGDHGNFLLYKGQLDTAERLKVVQSFINANLPELNGCRPKRICFVDDCALAGGKYTGLREIFDNLGFTRIDFAYLVAWPTFKHRDQDFVAVNDQVISDYLLLLAKDIGKTDPEMDSRAVVDQVATIVGMKAAA